MTTITEAYPALPEPGPRMTPELEAAIDALRLLAYSNDAPHVRPITWCLACLAVINAFDAAKEASGG
jgi:hypothetical protein